MRASVVIQVLLGAGALAHPHFKLNNPLAHLHHKRNQPVEVVTTIVGNQVEIEEIYVQTVWGPALTSTIAPTSTPAVVAVAAPEKLAVAPVANNQNLNQNSDQEGNQNWNGDNQDWTKWIHPSSAPASITPAAATPASVTPVSIRPSVTPVSVTPVQSSAASAPTSSNDVAPQSGGVSILDTANKYRAMFGFSAFSYNSTLAGNAAKTNADNGANAMNHELNPGSFAQCIAQADNNSGHDGLTPFELIYLGWLCEIPDNKITAVCKSMVDGTHMKVDTSDPGHAEILRDTSYSHMGCNYLTATQHQDNFAGMWTCDFK